MRDDVILVAMSPGFRTQYEAWLKDHGMHLQRMPDFGTPFDALPVYVIIPETVEVIE